MNQATYHQTDIELSRGQYLVPGVQGYCDFHGNQQIEQLFESQRPGHCIQRSKAVYVCLDPEDLDGAGGREGVVYQVEPVGDLEVSDLAWYTQAQIALDQGDSKQAQICADAYWSGTPFPAVSQRLPEGRCRLAKVESVYERSDNDLVPGKDVVGLLQASTGLAESAIVELLSVDPDILAKRGRSADLGERVSPVVEGSVLLSGYGDLEDRSIMVLEVLAGKDLQEAISTEHPERIRQHPTYAEYRSRLAAGEMPPPIMACRAVDGKVRSINRRRLLVAQELNIPIHAWVETLDEKTSPFTYGDFKSCLEKALAEEMVHRPSLPTVSADTTTISP